jgi:glyoxylase-like metal-dependent hydrolase (beta-lactamase superfamily II)
MPSEPLAPTTDALPAGIEHLPLPTPFPVGPVNAYLLLGDPLTIVDPGMVWDDTTDRITHALARHGHTVGDLTQIVITHGHPDHFGAAGWLAAHSDAAIVAGRAEAPKLLGHFDRDRMRGLVELLGMPEHVRDTFTGFYDDVRTLTHPIDPERLVLVDDGDTLDAGGRTWHAHVTPGHAVGHLSLYDPADRTLLSGDHLLACITPNPVLEPDPGTPQGRRRSLVEYLASLERFCRLDPLTILPGHGPRFTEVATLATAMAVHHHDRADEILTAVRHIGGDATPYELVGAVFPELTGFSIMLGISEIVGHLDLLEADGAVARTDDTPHRYAVA